MSFITETTDLGSPDRKFNKIYAKELVNGIVATTQTAGDNSNKIATTEYVDSAVNSGLQGKADKDRAYDLYDDFTIIYPNGGTEGSPANVTVNSRYVMDNPFSGYEVYAKVEIFYQDNWYEPRWMYYYTNSTDYSRGCAVSVVDNNIIIQTGINYLSSVPSQTGAAFGSNISSAPCRVKVWKIGKVANA